MRKLLFILLIVALLLISRCSSRTTKTATSDETPETSASPTSSSAYSKAETQTSDTEHSSKHDSITDSTTIATEETKNVRQEQTAQTTEPVQTEKKHPVTSGTKPSTSHPAVTEPVTTEPKPLETTTVPQESDLLTETSAGNDKPYFTQTDHDRIISEVVAYAESYKTKGYTFIWLDSMDFSWEVGYMGTPRIVRDGVDGVVRILKHHIDLIVKTTTDQENGIICDHMTYKVMQIDLNGEIAFVVVYGG